MPTIKNLISCNQFGEGVQGRGYKNGNKKQAEPFETMENLEVGEIDDYLNAVLKKCRRSQGEIVNVPINFLDSPRHSKSRLNE